MQKKSKIIIISVVSAILLIVGIFTAIALTGADNPTQAVATEKLSLGQKFLLDLEYDKAVAEFQAVIDIEPKNVDAYIGLADAYIGMGDEEKAIETLEKGLSETGDETIRAKLDEMKTPEETTAEVTTIPETTTTPKGSRTERVDFDDGSYLIHEYDKDGQCLKETVYYSNGESYGEATNGSYCWRNNKKNETVEYRFIHFNKCICEFDSDGNKIKNSWYNSEGTLDYYLIYEYDSNGNWIKESYYHPDGTFDFYSISEYDSNGNVIKKSYYHPDGTLDYYCIREYDSNGNRIKTSRYYPDGTPM